MGFPFIVLGKERKRRKLIRKYMKDRVEQKKVFDEQLTRLALQLRDKTIDQDTYDRLRDILEIHFLTRSVDAREKLAMLTRA